MPSSRPSPASPLLLHLHAPLPLIPLTISFSLRPISITFNPAMGSRNSEHSGSMDSDEFQNFIGHNYGIHHPLLALTAPNHDLLFDKVANPLPLSPETLRRIQEDTKLILAGGSVRQEQGPSQGAISSKSSKHSQTKSTDSVTKKGSIAAPALEDLQDNFQVQNGVLTVFVPKETEHNNNIEHERTTTSAMGTWSSIVVRNIPVTEASCSANAQITFNEDGFATLKSPKDFFIKC